MLQYGYTVGMVCVQEPRPTSTSHNHNTYISLHVVYLQGKVSKSSKLPQLGTFTSLLQLEEDCTELHGEKLVGSKALFMVCHW